MENKNDSRLVETEKSRERLYSGKILDLDRVMVTLPNGKEAAREVVVHKGAAAIIPINGRGEAALVRQYRAALKQVTLEIPAGKLDRPGEDPFECAVRELKEETGLVASGWRLLTRMYSAAGFCDELISVYLATDLRQSEASPDEDEFVNVVWMPLDELYKMAMDGQITDSKTLIAILMAAQP